MPRTNITFVTPMMSLCKPYSWVRFLHSESVSIASPLKHFPAYKVFQVISKDKYPEAHPCVDICLYQWHPDMQTNVHLRELSR